MGVFARTAPDAADARLRGRTYGIPFHDVWEASVKLASGGLKRWRIVRHDEYDGLIHAEALTALRKRTCDVEIRIALDEDAQTRVDMMSESRQGAIDWGGNVRRIALFFSALDHELAKPRAERTKGAR